MNTDEEKAIEAVIELCRNTRARLLPTASFRIRVLIEMTMIELDRELARLRGNRPA